MGTKKKLLKAAVRAQTHRAFGERFPTPSSPLGGICHSANLMGLMINKAGSPQPGQAPPPLPHPNLCSHVPLFAPSPGPTRGERERRKEPAVCLTWMLAAAAETGEGRVQTGRAAEGPRSHSRRQTGLQTGTLNQPHTQATCVLCKFLVATLKTHTKKLALILHLIRYIPNIIMLGIPNM